MSQVSTSLITGRPTQGRWMSKAGLDFLKQWEGFSPVVYMCQANYPTIGFGHVVRNGEVFDKPLTIEEGEELLKKDIRRYELSVHNNTPVELHPMMFDALVSFTYNLGTGAYRASTLRKCVIREEHDEAGRQFLRWNKAAGRVSRGLLRRRVSESELYLRGAQLLLSSDVIGALAAASQQGINNLTKPRGTRLSPEQFSLLVPIAVTQLLHP